MMTRLFTLASATVLTAALTAPAAPYAGGAARTASVPIPWEQLPPGLLADVRGVVERPTLTGQGPSETFPCRAEHYFYFLDHPDRAVTAWRRLGAKCVSITDLGQNWFGWTDELGSQVNWQTVYKDSEKRVWYAQGKIKPSTVLPAVPVRVVVFLYHTERPAGNGQTVIEHHSDMFIHTDSKFTALVTKMIGSSAPRMAEQGLGQLQMFFSALCSYLNRHPQNLEVLLRAD